MRRSVGALVTVGAVLVLLDVALLFFLLKEWPDDDY